MSIDANVANAIDRMNDRSRDALGYSTPGAQPKFHEAMSSKTQAIGVEDPLSVAAPALSFFVVQNPDGTRGYVRAGNFQIRDCKLMTQDGRQVLGYPMDRSQGGLVPLSVPEGTPDGWVNIAADGTISVADPKVRNAADLGSNYLAQTMEGVSNPLFPDTQGMETHQRAIERAKSLGLTDSAIDAMPSNPTPMSNAGMSTLDPNAGPVDANAMSAAAANNAAQVMAANDQATGQAIHGVAANNGPAPKHFRPEDEEDALDRAADERANIQAQAGATNEGLVAGVLKGSDAPAFGQPVGRIALARFGYGTTVDSNGAPTSRVPVELGVPNSGQIGKLRTNSRDLGNVDLLNAATALMNSSQILTAVMTDFQSQSSRQKTAMGLIK